VAGFVRRTAIAKGVLGGSRFWMLVAVIIYTRKLVRRFMGNAPAVVYSEELRPGQSLLISHERDAAIVEG
jgi:hypothetical protein